MSRVVRIGSRAVRLKVPILIRGETGTGKEVLARHAHQASGRQGPFIAVNCAVLPESLITAELFGYQAGAFTGARPGGAAGLIRQANGGTLFLDEIGDMPPALQATLLRLLDHWTVRPIGSTAEYKVDIQLITATNCDLKEAVLQQRFRADLLYRINTVEVVLPPLRHRTDFQAIVCRLLAELDSAVSITDEALQRLACQRWEGNIRALKNVLTRLLLLAQDSTSSWRRSAGCFPCPLRPASRGNHWAVSKKKSRR